MNSIGSLPLISVSSINSPNNTKTRLINPSPKSSFNFKNSEFKYSTNLNNNNNNNNNNNIKVRQFEVKVKAVDDVSVSTTLGDPTQAQLSWEIIVGALAGVIPFIVAGIEFSKRIVAQRRCEVCGGSGLVLRDKKYYFRCPSCGGFLPWQSWRRFFSG